MGLTFIYFFAVVVGVVVVVAIIIVILRRKAFPNIQKGKCNEACKLKAFVGV